MTNTSWKRSYLPVVGGALTALLLTSCGAPEENDAPQREERVVTVESARVEEQEWRITVRAVGHLEADEAVTVRNEVAGIIQSIPVQEGALVEAGEVLVQIDDERAILERERALAAYEEAQATRQRREPLFEKELISEEEWAHTKAAYRRTAAEYGLADRRQRDTRVRAPLSGQLGRRHVALGDYVAVATPLFELVKVDQLKLEFDLPERYLGQVRTGQTVRVESAAHPDTLFEGKVDFVNPVIRRTTRTLPVRARIANEAGLLKPNQFVEIALDLDVIPDAVVIPEEAIISDLGEFLCYVIDEEDRAEMRRLTLGERAPGKVQVIDGVQAGERVVAAGHQRLRPGTRVQDRNAESAP